MDKKLIEKVESEYPYPIAVEFRKLLTSKNKNRDINRLQQILRTAENIIHIIMLISLVDLLENYINMPFEIPEIFKKTFRKRFCQLTFGKCIVLMRETVKIFKENNRKMFIEELANYFIKGKNKESEAQTAFNNMTRIRNKIAHPKKNLTRKDFENYCDECEKNLETIITKLDFITNYPFLYVESITVKYHKWRKPNYFHTFAKVIGLDSDFSCDNYELSDIINTPAVVIVKNSNIESISANDCLDLDPFIIYSDQGRINDEFSGINDLYLFLEWDVDKKSKNIIYKPCYKGGEFNLDGTEYEDIHKEELLKISEFFASFDDYQSLKKSLNSVAD